jgi:two-component system, chemotaxis family, protein-glutamate methylesterase/glutaminase
MLTAREPRQDRLPAQIDAVVIGASAGAIEALAEVLGPLPASTPWPVLVVVHLPPNRPSLLTALFARKCSLPVREVLDKDALTGGIWFAPPDYHLLIESGRTLALSTDEPVNHSRPSIDVLFESAAGVYGAGLVAIVLTGASSDGANGAKAVRDAGGYVIVQDPATAEAATMPSEAIKKSAPQWVASLDEIGRALGDAALRIPS